jgi:hypothetical protein
LLGVGTLPSGLPGGSVIPLGPVNLTATSIPGDIFKGAFVTGSEAERWGLGVVQEIDSAAMHLWARWQHQSLDTNIVGVTVNDPIGCSAGAGAGNFSFNGVAHVGGDCSTSKTKIKQNWDDWDLFQVGGIIFF